MFEHLRACPPDPILGISVLYAADSNPAKIDVGVGVYRDATGATPIMESVLQAQALLAATQTSKSYLPTAGNAAFNRAITELVLGLDHVAVREDRAVTLQTPGGCGALRLAADLIHTANAKALVAVSRPTWSHHHALIGGAGVSIIEYPYYDHGTHTLLYASMLEALEQLPSGSVVLLQPSCHNPTGADLTPVQWHEIGALLLRRGLVPLLDLAYQGLGEGLLTDVYAVHHLASILPEVLITVSCSKNFGLYRERTGAVIYVGRSPADKHAIHTQLMTLARRLYSMAPDHGAAIVGTLWEQAALRQLWMAELEAMRRRVHSLRQHLAAQLKEASPLTDFEFIAKQSGMFSLLGLTQPQVEALRVHHHVYCAPDSRINVAGLNEESVARLAAAIAAVVRSP